MIQFDSNDRLIQALGANLTTVRRLPSPGLRALMWLAILASIALALAMVSDVNAHCCARGHGRIRTLAARSKSYLGAAAIAFSFALDRRQRNGLPEDLVCCGNFSNAA